MRLLKILALLVTVLVPVLMTGSIMYERAAAPVYKVRIEGYDPRDLLYGHYLTFRFAPDKSAEKETFTRELYDALPAFDGRYYIPERHAATIERTLIDGKSTMEIGVGVPKRGKAFLETLYINGAPMRDFLNDFENRVDLDGDTERK